MGQPLRILTSLSFAFAMGFAASASLFAQGKAAEEKTAASAPTLPLVDKVKENQSPWHVSCKHSLGMGKKERRSVCRGSVRLYRDDISVTCDTAELYHDEKWGVKRAVCVENVVLKAEQGRATAEKAEFDNVTRWLVLTGNPVLYQGASEVRGKVIRYNLDTEEFEVQQMRGRMDRSAGPEASPKAPKSQPQTPDKK